MSFPIPLGSSVPIGTVSPSPPPEVMDAIDVAWQACDRLAAAGRRLHFHRDFSTKRVIVEVKDAAGDVVDTLSPSAALRIAEGDALP